MIKALDPYLQRKVLKEPKPQTLDEAVARTWEAFRTAQPPAPFVPQSPAPSYAPTASAPPPGPAMELDTVRQMPQAPNAFAWQQPLQSHGYNVFSGRPLTQTFGQGGTAPRDIGQVNAVAFQATRAERDRSRDERRPDSRGRSTSRSSQASRRTPSPSSDRSRLDEGRKCDQKKAKESRDSKRSSRSDTRDTKRKLQKGCFFCGDEGHWAADCPKKAEWLSHGGSRSSIRKPSRSPSPSQRQSKVSGR
jgi:hypothetical protein